MASLLTGAFGVSQISSGAQAGTAPQGQPEQSVAGLFQAQVEYGYWLTAAALIVCAAACAMILWGDRDRSPSLPQ